jgi:hypothetical protein
MTVYGAGSYSVDVTWNDGKVDTHKFGSLESRERFLKTEAKNPEIKKVTKNG